MIAIALWERSILSSVTFHICKSVLCGQRCQREIPVAGILGCLCLFSSQLRKYRKSYMYCSHPGIGVGVAQMLKFLLKVLSVILYLLNMLMDYVVALHVGRYWSEVLFCAIMTHLGDLEVKVTDLEILCLSFCKSISIECVDGVS